MLLVEIIQWGDSKMLYEKLQKYLFDGEAELLSGEITNLLSLGIEPLDIINDGMMKEMDRIGELFSRNELFVPEVLISAWAMQSGIRQLKPFFNEESVVPKGSVVIGTVAGDLHDIGKNLVCMFLEANGYQVKDLGVDVSPETFVTAAEEGAQVIALSTLLTTNMPVMKETIELLEKNNLRKQVKVIIGGAPVSQAYADRIGADGYAKDAASASKLCDFLLGDQNAI